MKAPTRSSAERVCKTIRTFEQKWEDPPVYVLPNIAIIRGWNSLYIYIYNQVFPGETIRAKRFRAKRPDACLRNAGLLRLWISLSLRAWGHSLPAMICSWCLRFVLKRGETVGRRESENIEILQRDLQSFSAFLLKNPKQQCYSTKCRNIRQRRNLPENFSRKEFWTATAFSSFLNQGKRSTPKDRPHPQKSNHANKPNWKQFAQTVCPNSFCMPPV